MTDVNQTYCDHFSVHTNIASLCCIPETYNVVCQLYLNEKAPSGMGWLGRKEEGGSVTHGRGWGLGAGAWRGGGGGEIAAACYCEEWGGRSGHARSRLRTPREAMCGYGPLPGPGDRGDGGRGCRGTLCRTWDKGQATTSICNVSQY